MKAKDLFAKIWYAAVNFLGGVVLVLLCNPVMMCIFNLVFPEDAACFVREFIGFNNFWRKFYMKQALKWPFPWSRHWITLDNLNTCSTRKQIAYYLANRTNGMIVKSMSSEAQVALIHRHPEVFDLIDGQMRLTDDMFAEWLNYFVREIRKNSKPEHLQDLEDSLSDHLRTGKLPFSQVMILIKAAVDEYNNSACPLMDYLKDYIERFGLSPKQLEELAQYMCDNLDWHDPFGEEPVTDYEKEYKQHMKFNHFLNMLSERQTNYEQRLFARSQRGLQQTSKWREFCANTSYICVAAQEEMDIERYKIFHATGHTLRKEVIVYFLRYPDRALHRLVFRYEPLEMFEKEDIKNLINNIYMREVFDKEMAKRKKKA